MALTPTRAKILVVDDEPSILLSIEDLLEAEFDVLTTTDPQVALDMLQADDVSVVVSDQRMPSMNGDEFLRAARERSAALRILLTGFADIEAIARVVNDGKIYSYVTKPWNPVELRTTIRNAANEHRLRNALSYERDLLRTLVNNIPDCVYVQDSAQRYTLVNQAFAKLAGLTDPQEAVGKTELECLPGNFGSNAYTDGGKILKTGEAVISKCDEWKGDDASVRWYSSTRVPVRNPVDRAIDGLVGISRDVSDQKQIENHLREAKETAEETVRAKQEFLARTSHEIRTPLNSILGMTELLTVTPLSEQQQQYIAVLKRNGGMLMRLLDDLIDLSRGDLRQLKLVNDEFDLVKVVNGVIEPLRLNAAVKAIELRADFGAGISERMMGDAERLKQILNNLVGNALKFTERGEVVIRANAAPLDGRAIRIDFAVEDSGIGIASNQLEAIFEPFTQSEKFITGKYGGTGLGLTISRQLVQQMGGTIQVESALGVGSIFRFSTQFEVAEEVPAEKETKDAAKPLTAPKDNLHILLAEDNEDNVFLVQCYLGSEKVEVASNGREAFEKFVAGKFDVVLMDLQMPEMDGLQATRLIREWEEKNNLATTPVLACTAHSDAIDDSLQAGCTGHLSKPLGKHRLLEAINGLK